MHVDRSKDLIVGWSFAEMDPQCNPNQNSSAIFGKHLQTCSKICKYVKRPRKSTYFKTEEMHY